MAIAGLGFFAWNQYQTSEAASRPDYDNADAPVVAMKLRDLSPVIQMDIKSLFGGYQQACTTADLMLLSLGNLDVVAE